MFSDGFDFQYVTSLKGGPTDSFQKVYLYSFRAENERYIFRAEKFGFDVYAVKFYPKKFELSDDKYRLLTNEGKAPRIIATCLRIMLSILEDNPNASFCFRGAELIGEEKADSKRFRIYRYAIEARFSSVRFTHYHYKAQSVYLLLNRANQAPDLLEKVQQQFLQIFEFEGKPED